MSLYTTSSKASRNKEIFINILKGYTYAELGEIYNITPNRCRQIVFFIMARIRRKYPEFIGKLYTTKAMRQNKNRLISILEED